MTVNIDNVRATLDSIRQHGPEHFDMSCWFAAVDTAEFDLWDASQINLNRCGTTGCLAGHAAVAAWNMGVDVTRWQPEHAADWLGLPGGGYVGSDDYFSGGAEWPEAWRRYRDARMVDEDLITAEWHTVIWGLEQLIKKAEERAE